MHTSDILDLAWVKLASELEKTSSHKCAHFCHHLKVQAAFILLFGIWLQFILNFPLRDWYVQFQQLKLLRQQILK